jgi:hypothetical protein
MCADAADLVIATDSPVTIGQPDAPTTLNYSNVTFQPKAELIVQGSVTMNVTGTFNGGVSGVLMIDGVITVVISMTILAGTLSIKAAGDPEGQVMIYYGSTEPGWHIETVSGISLTVQQI